MTITGKSKSQVGIQFGAYGSFLSFFGLAQLPAVSENFTGIVDYASSMTFELVTNSTVSNTSYPSNDEISVRFLFSNGTAAENPLTAYPLFNQSETVIPWSTFVTQMNKFAIGDEASWCKLLLFVHLRKQEFNIQAGNACGNATGVCASTATSPSSGSSSSATSTSTSSSGGGMSRAVAGVIGAMVALAVVLGVEALIMLLGGLRLVSKKRLGAGNVTPQSATPGTKA